MNRQFQITNIPVSAINKNSRQEICNRMENLNNTINQQDLRDIYRTLHRTKEFTSLLTHGTFNKRDHILSHKANLNESESVEITLSVNSDQM